MPVVAPRACFATESHAAHGLLDVDADAEIGSGGEAAPGALAVLTGASATVAGAGGATEAGAAPLALAAGDEEAADAFTGAPLTVLEVVIAVAPLGTVEQRDWKSSLARLSWAALVKSDAVILYFLAAAFSTFSEMPSRRSESMEAASCWHAGSTLGVAGKAEVVSKLSPRLLHPAARTVATANAAAMPSLPVMDRSPDRDARPLCARRKVVTCVRSRRKELRPTLRRK